MSQFKIKQNDTRPLYTGTLEIDEVGVSLAGASLLFKMRNADGTLKVNAAATPDADQATNPGLFSYSWVAADTDEAGKFEVEIEVTFGDGTVQTFPTRGFEYVIVYGDLDS